MRTARRDNSGMKSLPALALGLLFVGPAWPSLRAFEKQPASTYRARRVALAEKLEGGVAILFAAEEPQLDFTPFRQESNFYYLTGWTEPGAALLIAAEAPHANPQRAYKEILFLPARDLRMEKYTGVKMDAATPGAAQLAGVDAVEPMAQLPAELSGLLAADRSLLTNLWTQPDTAAAEALLTFTAATLGSNAALRPHDVTGPEGQLRMVKDAGEIELIKKASAASIIGQRVMMQWWV